MSPFRCSTGQVHSFPRNVFSALSSGGLLAYVRCFNLPSRASRLAITTLLLGTAALRAHPEIEAALTRLNSAITAAPDDAELYLTRGDLYAKHDAWAAAEANYLRAAELAPSLPGLARSRGALALSTQEFTGALAHLNEALKQSPTDAEALILRVGARVALGDRGGGLADLEAALKLLPSPGPELFLTRAKLHVAPADAIASLDAAIARIGPAHTLQLRALEIEEANGFVDQALRRLDTLARQSERQEIWLKRRGDLLSRAGRHAQALEAYAAALAAVERLPQWLRDSPDSVALAAELARLTSANPPSSS